MTAAMSLENALALDANGNPWVATNAGAFYFNGKSSQFQTFNNSEEQIGMGVWYDF